VSKQNAYFIMEYFRAPNLKSMLRTDMTGAQVRAKKMMECVSQALAHMHERGWVHRDIKPDNILINKGSEIRLIDFGLAAHPKSIIGKLLSSKKRTAIQGTRTYLAPELIERKPLSISSDIYALGVTFYEVLTGRPPFVSGNPSDLLMMHVRDQPEKPSGYNSNVSPECDTFVLSMLAKKPNKRPGSMQEVFAVVRNLRFFNTDAEEAGRIRAAEAEDRYAKSLSARLDSRVDAGRTVEEKAVVAAEVKKGRDDAEKKRKERLAKIAKAEKGTAPQKPTPASAPAYAPMPQMPAYPAPGMPMPGMPMPGYPGYGYPGAMPMPPAGFPVPGYGQPGMPGMPPVMPGAPPAAVPAPAAAKPAAKPTPQAPPARPTPSTPAKRPPAATPPPDDIPLMEELPEVI